MTAAQDVETAVRSMKEGAFDYLVKPVEESRLIASVGTRSKCTPCADRWAS